MDNLSRAAKEKIVQQEIKALWEHGYLTEQEYTRFKQGYRQYCLQLKEQSDLRQRKVHMEEKEQESPGETEMNAVSSTSDMANHQPVKPSKPAKPKKTKEQLRERNITWLLILGVMFLLISGLVVATSTWEQMGALLKVMTLLGVSLFFLALSGLCSRFLHIKKTAFAFLTLGSLLLPITILAIGYFGLFGDYLTLTGEGRYLLGLLCTLIPLPLYVRNALVTKSKLFIWITFIFLSFVIGFSFAALRLPIDLFYLFIMLYNAALLLVYHRFHRQKQMKMVLFLKELPAFAQLNLIISTLLMLIVFDQAIFYSFNVLLTAFLYMAMVFVYQTRAYQFVFIALFAYSVYQFTEHSWLYAADLLIYASLGIGYLLFAYMMRKDHISQKIFYYTSGVITIFAFIYISFQGIIVRGNSDSWILLAAYLVIAATYSYLAHISERQIFRWLAPIFLFTFGLQLWNVAIEPYFAVAQSLFIFVYAVCLFFFVGGNQRYSFLQAIQTSTYYLSLMVMLLTILLEYMMTNYTTLAVLLALFGGVALFVSSSKKAIERQIAEWAHAVSWLLAFLFFYPMMTDHVSGYQLYVDMPYHMGASSLLLLAVCKLWDKQEKDRWAHTAFYVGQVSYYLALLLLAVNDVNHMDGLRTSFIFIGIGLAVWLVRRSKQTILWGLVALLTLACYLSIYSLFPWESYRSFVWFIVFAPVLLLVIDRVAGSYEKALQPYFFWLAHLFQLIVLGHVLIGSLFSNQLHPVILVIPVMIYLYSTLTKIKEWQIKLQLYAAMLIGSWMINEHASYYDWTAYIPAGYIWLGTLVFISIIWFFVPIIWKRRMEWYWIPMANLQLLLAITFLPIDSIMRLGFLIGFIILTLFFIHVRKWYALLLLPLLTSLWMWSEQQVIIESGHLLLVSLLMFLLLIVAGRYLFMQLYAAASDRQLTVDWYAVGALLYTGFALALSMDFTNVWLEIIPYLLLSSWLYLQIKRLEGKLAPKVFFSLAALSLLPAYYLILNEYLRWIDPLWHAELRVFPILVLSLLLSIKTWRQYQQIVSHVQTIILVFITVYLVYDAIQSSTIWDAFIIGTLSVISFLAGMKYQIKSYFFVGLGTLLFNVIYQTRPYWGNMPWWGYLLIVGLLFIAIASYNEWQKQQETEGKLVKHIKKMVARLKEWN